LALTGNAFFGSLLDEHPSDGNRTGLDLPPAP